MPDSIPRQMNALLSGMATLTDSALKVDHRMGALESKVDTMEAHVRQTKDILEAWAAVKSGGKFIIWIGKVLVAIGAIMLVAKSGFLALVWK